MDVGIYHKFLRISAVVVTMVLLFDSGFLSPFTKKLSDNAINYVASGVTGMSAQVQPNELNELSEELSEWERSLVARESELEGREIAARDFGTGESPDYSIYILSAILFILTVLIVLNYALDYQRMRRIQYERQTT